MSKLQSTMTPKEVAEMEEICKKQIIPEQAKLTYRCGFLAGKVSALAAITDLSIILYDTTTGSEGKPPTSSEERVETEG